ncbi:alternative ribosome rescue aminoacyl-tRNA hydrolase ArfB [Allostreptomyces psammosilenae]|uniref:Ribosome-associated protein n=1 Tax=Allostreptomyces psammosilenae TaxID=1892865 RepID=A0A852ZZP3_9ACTN|nr:alternative ribosome rescue aminoacyl-tRNA hydrolase ArfB [Allostreptomyces psammosilenae]NYI07619.1 ribosome-associated protein [Allostreptomyces psammosilenae]
MDARDGTDGRKGTRGGDGAHGGDIAQGGDGARQAGRGGGVRVRGTVVVPESELQWRFSRSSGPGGQHVNTTDSQVELRFDLAASTALPPAMKERAQRRLADRLVGGAVLVVRASSHRSQWRNRQDALARLADLLNEATAPPPRARRSTRPSKASVERRLAAKKLRGRTKEGRGRWSDG